MKDDLSSLNVDTNLNKKPVSRLNAFKDAGESFYKSFTYSAFQAPVNGLLQIYDHVTDSHLEQKAQVFEPPKLDKFGSLNWVASQIGNGLGIGLDFMVLDKAIGSDKLALSNSAIIKKAAINGAVYEGIFSPSSNSHNFWVNRGKDAISGALTFSSMACASLGLNNVTTRLGTSNSLVVQGLVTGLTGGIVGVNSQSLLDKGKLADFNNDLQSVTAFVVAGIPLSLGDTFVKNTNVKALKLEDLTPVSDIKITANHELASNPIKELFPELEHSQPDLIQIPIHDKSGNLIHTFNLNIPKFPNFPDIPSYELPEEAGCLFAGEHYTTDNGTMISKNKNNTVYLFPDDTKIITGDGYTKIQLPDDKEFNLTDSEKTYYKNQNTYEVSSRGYSSIKGKNGIYFDRNNEGIIFYRSPQDQAEITLTPATQKGSILPYSIKAKLQNTSLVVDSYGNYNADLSDGSSVNKIGDTLSYWSKEGIETRKDGSGKIEVFDHKAQYEKLLGQIVEKFNQDHFSISEYNSLLDKFNGSDKSVAKAILEVSLPNLSPQNLIKALKTLDISSSAFHGDNTYYTLDASSIGNMLGYLGGKVLNNNFNILTLNETTKRAYSEIFTFDRPDKLDKQTLKLLKDNYREKITYIDLNNFEDGLNFLDRAQGRLESKLSQLVKRVNDLKKSSPSMGNLSDLDLTKRLLNKDAEKFAKDNDIKIIRPKISNSLNDWFEPPVNEKIVSDFLDDKEAVYKQNFKYKFELAKFLAESTQYNSVADIMQKCRDLYEGLAIDMADKSSNSDHTNLEKSAKDFENGSEQANKVKFVIGLDGEFGSGSAAFINYLFKVSNKLADSNFISRSQFLNLAKDPNSKFIYLDDTAYSGTQIENMINRYFEKSRPKLHLALLGAYKDFYRNFKNNYDIGITTLQTHFPLSTDFIDGQINALTASLLNSPKGQSDQEAIKNSAVESILNLGDLRRILAFSNSFGNINSAIVWPYMVPDNSFNLLGEFGRKVFGFGQNHDTI